METEEKRGLILDKLLEKLQTSRFNIFTLQAVASELEITEGELNLLFSEGLNGVVKALFERHKSELKAYISGMEKAGITEGVKLSILASFHLLEPNKKALRKIVRFLILPNNILQIPKFLYEISDSIWKGLEVNDSNFSFYSKRLILSTIYSNSFVYFIASKSHLKLEMVVSKQLSLLTKVASKFKK